MRTFVELVERYVDPELCPYPEYKGKPYYSIKYIENGEEYVGYSTYSMQVMSGFLKKYFMSSALEKQEQDRWIPVTERLPEYGQVVQWCNENGSVFSSAITYKRGDDWAIGKRHRYKRVLAWRPLPEPYTEEES